MKPFEFAALVPMPPSTPLDLVRPLLWIAAFAFLIGFAAVLVFAALASSAHVAAARAEPPEAAATLV
jgi:hypothetical protein